MSVATHTSAPIGFIGMGRMGTVMARHILASGRSVIGWDRRSEALEPLVAAGGIAASTISDLAAASIVISIVFDDEGTREITFGPEGLINTLAPGAVHVVMASISPALSRVLSEAHEAKGQQYLAASVFGRPEAAEAAALLVNCSGSSATYQTLEPIFATMGRSQWVGPEPEQAMLLKTIGNSMIYTSVELLREMFAFLRAGGIDERKAKELLVDTLFSGQIFSGYADRYIADPNSTKMTDIAFKDRRNCLDAAEQMGVHLPLVQFLRDQKLP